MKTKNFIGRSEELEQLELLTKNPGASFAVIKGRRRIGKSRLIQEFSNRQKRYQTLSISAPPPNDKFSDQHAREDFAEQVGESLKCVPPRADSWNQLFWFVADRVKTGRWILVLDEINWMGSQDEGFLGKLKNAWDQHFSKAEDLILILSGSLTSWIERNILHDTGFVGRVDLDLTLREMPLRDCQAFWGARAERISAHEKFQLLAITGGIPRYLEAILPMSTAADNIQRLCFNKGGLLFREFGNLFDDLFSHRVAIYQNIIEAIAERPMSLDELHAKLGKPQSGVLGQYIDELEECGFVQRDYTWTIKSAAESRLSRVRVSDNYLRFYLKAILPHRRAIERGHGKLPKNLSSLLGFQFENLVLNNRQQLWSYLSVDPADIVQDNPFFQRPTQRQKGCQVDYMIQVRQQTLFVCEIKFHKKPLGLSVVDEVKEKIDRISLPKGFSIRPVLIHVNGVQDSVLDADYFDNLVSFSDFL